MLDIYKTYSTDVWLYLPLLAPLVLNLVLSGVIDGDFLPDEPYNLFHNAAEIDYIAGVNDMDGHLFTGLDVPSINSPLVDTSVWVQAISP